MERLLLQSSHQPDGDGSTDTNTKQQLQQQRYNNTRLEMIANYEYFHPLAMACSDPMIQSQNYAPQQQSSLLIRNKQWNSNNNTDATPPPQQQQQQQHNLVSVATSAATATTVSLSLGAISGSDGIIVFRWDEPHIPMLVLNHHTTASTTVPNSTTTSHPSYSSTGVVATVLAFSPIQNAVASSSSSSLSSIYLASTRGSGILIWDVSGHSLQPLQARLGMTPSGGMSTTRTGAAAATITSMTWISLSSGSSTNRYTIVATTSSIAGIWDIRLPPTTSSSTVSDINNTSIQRPCIRFADATHHSDDSPYIQIACSHCSNDSYECAILDASGMVCIYNIRVTATKVTTTTTVVDRPIHQFDACHYTSIGLKYIPLLQNDSGVERNGWVIWGFDAPNTDPIVKVWMNGADMISSSSNTKTINGNDTDISSAYRLVGQCTTPNLACARVCPSPVSNTIVTVAFKDPNEGSGALDWRTDVWKLQFHVNTSSNNKTETKQIFVHPDDDDDDDYGLTPDSTLEHVTTVDGPSDAAALESVLGGKHLMSLRATEVTLSGASTNPYGKNGLLLCCLTENGYVTTHAIPEVYIEQNLNSTSIRDSEARVRTGIMTTSSTIGKLFPANAELPIVDAASAWGKSLDDSTNVVTPVDRTTFLERSAAISKGMLSFTGTESATITVENDVPIPYFANATVSDIPLGAMDEGLPSSSFNVQTNNNFDQTDVNTTSRNAAEIMAKIDTDRIPCPRLSGASFSCGVGGLTVFNNGGVKRMWDWYEKRDPSRAGTVPGLIGEQSLQDLLDGRGDQPVSGSRKSICFPRTLKDLISMTQSAKEAQWGEQEEAGGLSMEFPVFGNDFFDDDSNASSDSGADNFEDSGEKLEEYEQARDKNVLSSNETAPVTTSAASDMLTPLVKVLNEYVSMSLNKQSFKLAERWKLGEFDVSVSQPAMERRNKPKLVSFSPFVYPFLDTTILSTNLVTKQALPSYRSLLPTSPDRKDEMNRGGKAVEHETVHGGEYSVRPNMQESMEFLRKLFTQQHQQEGKTPFPDLLSPPDDSMLPSKTTAPRTLLVAAPKDSRQLQKVDGDALRLGVHTIPADIGRDVGDMEKIESICSHNATACEELGEVAKMGTWRLVAKLVQSKRKRSGRGFDGWGDSLGVNLMGNLLTFYESLGDVQMLASLVCVLRNRDQYQADGTKRRGLALLPADQNTRYDLYIRYYSELLYGWGLLAKRAEVIKHLSQVVVSDRNAIEGLVAMDSGIAFDVECPRCSGNTHSGFCRPCNDFSFRCSICENAVRGLFTVCIICGHGGHVPHVKEWFLRSNKCPTGCGCTCRLSSTH